LQFTLFNAVVVALTKISPSTAERLNTKGLTMSSESEWFFLQQRKKRMIQKEKEESLNKNQSSIVKQKNQEDTNE
tara:strand:+ start:108 stop:332 length:225 start_codon:yes stop_codon:yes gene_type:complete